MVFFKRRSRTNSYIEDSPPSRQRSQSYDLQERYDRPESQHNQQAFSRDGADLEKDMYARPQGPQDVGPGGAFGGPQRNISMNSSGHAMPMSSIPMSGGAGGMPGTPGKADPVPDLLTQAFNAALRPQMEKIDGMEQQIADLQSYVDQLEMQRREVFEWIDKRGLRPDVPPTVAKAMDTATPASAQTLSAQLDRKITIVNFDLHRLQDDLNSPLPTGHFAAAMLKFLPDIDRLSTLNTGPRLAFDLILKLGGNLNSHGGLDSGDPEDLRARKDFYSRLDSAMVNVVRGRFNEGEEWAVGREIKRIEKTANYLRTFGVEPYFPSTLDLMRREEGFMNGGGMGGPPPQAQMMNGNGTPPRRAISTTSTTGGDTPSSKTLVNIYNYRIDPSQKSSSAEPSPSPARPKRKKVSIPSNAPQLPPQDLPTPGMSKLQTLWNCSSMEMKRKLEKAAVAANAGRISDPTPILKAVQKEDDGDYDPFSTTNFPPA